MNRRTDAATLLERALTQHAMAEGITLTIDATRSTRWASATFVGARHRLELGVTGPTARAWLAGLAEAELPIRRHLVADVIVVAEQHVAGGSTATIEVLTVEDGD